MKCFIPLALLVSVDCLASGEAEENWTNVSFKSRRGGTVSISANDRELLEVRYEACGKEFVIEKARLSAAIEPWLPEAKLVRSCGLIDIDLPSERAVCYESIRIPFFDSIEDVEIESLPKLSITFSDCELKSLDVIRPVKSIP